MQIAIIGAGNVGRALGKVGARADRRAEPRLMMPVSRKGRGRKDEVRHSRDIPGCADGRVTRGAVICARLVAVPTAGSRQLVDQPLRFSQIAGVEALGEPAVNGCQQIASFGPPTLFAPQSGEACRDA